MKNVERFKNTLTFGNVDRLPVLEWAGWWNLTIDRWHTEGLPSNLKKKSDFGDFNIRKFFGMDGYDQLYIKSRIAGLPSPAAHGQGIITDMDSYQKAKEFLYPQQAFSKKVAEYFAPQVNSGDLAVSISPEGFFWFPRELLGIERHMYAFYDQPELIHTINSDLLKFHMRVIDEICQYFKPVFLYFMEDMSYNHGPMLSENIFNEFLAPYYRQIVPRVKEHGIIPFVDSDGDIEQMVPWLTGVGIEGFLPLERQAGVDIVALRKKYPRLKILGAYDKMVMSKDESTMRAEFERILPVMKQGGYVPGVDHQTPPEVSLENYKIYLRLLNEYCRKAVA